MPIHQMADVRFTAFILFLFGLTFVIWYKEYREVKYGKSKIYNEGWKDNGQEFSVKYIQGS